MEKFSVIWICWGGSQSFQFATSKRRTLKVYGFITELTQRLSTLKNIKSPVYGFYGGPDNRVNATIPDTEKNYERIW